MKTIACNLNPKICKYVLLLVWTFGILLIPSSCKKNELSQQLIQGTNYKNSVLQIGTVVKLFEPVRFTRGKGNAVTELFSVPRFSNDVFENSFQLKISNGIGSNLSVTSAQITIDGIIVLSSKDFKKDKLIVTKEVELKAEGSTMEVRLEGKPGSFIDLWLEGTKREIGLVAYYPFNGNAKDESGYNNHGTLYGPVLSTDRFGNANSAYFFDGINDFIRIENSPSLDVTSAISVCAWVKCSNISDHGRIVSKWGTGPEYACSFDLCFTSWSEALFEVLDLPVNSPTGIGFGPVSTGEWYFLVGTFDGVNINLYINGELKATAPFPKTLYPGLPMFIGGENGSQLFFNGIIDDVRIYNRALTMAEILALNT